MTLKECIINAQKEHYYLNDIKNYCFRYGFKPEQSFEIYEIVSELDKDKSLFDSIKLK